MTNFFAEGLRKTFSDLLDHFRKIVLLKLFPGFFIAVGFVFEKVLFDELLDHGFLILLAFFRHCVLDFFHVFEDLFFRVLFKSLDGVIELN